MAALPQHPTVRADILSHVSEVRVRHQCPPPSLGRVVRLPRRALGPARSRPVRIGRQPSAAAVRPERGALRLAALPPRSRMGGRPLPAVGGQEQPGFLAYPPRGFSGGAPTGLRRAPYAHLPGGPLGTLAALAPLRGRMGPRRAAGRPAGITRHRARIAGRHAGQPRRLKTLDPIGPACWGSQCSSAPPSGWRPQRPRPRHCSGLRLGPAIAEMSEYCVECSALMSMWERPQPLVPLCTRGVDCIMRLTAIPSRQIRMLMERSKRALRQHSNRSSASCGSSGRANPASLSALPEHCVGSGHAIGVCAPRGIGSSDRWQAQLGQNVPRARPPPSRRFSCKFFQLARRLIDREGHAHTQFLF